MLGGLDATIDGMSSGEAARRRELFGPNRIIEAKSVICFSISAAGWRTRWSPSALRIGDRRHDRRSCGFVIIVSVVLLSTGMDIVQERRAEATAEALKHSIALRVLALRDGKQQEIPVEELVPGDIVHRHGRRPVPADGIVLEANAAQVNQAALTASLIRSKKAAEVLNLAR